MTKIEWTTRPGGPRGKTWNPWVGCDEIAPECGLLAPGNPKPEGGGGYAAAGAGRGMHEPHRGTAVKGKWTGVIHRNTPTHRESPRGFRAGTLCFTCSYSDFWHERVPLTWLDEALDMIAATPWVTYQILTKRPGMIARRLANLGRRWPDNAWCGVTVGHPQSLPLLKIPRRIDAPVRFISVEPLLAPMVPGLDLTDYQWAIGGGESGHHARPCLPDWMRAVRDVRIARGVPFFLKQWGVPENNPTPWDQELDPDAKGGATLDGRLWREFPPLTESETRARP
jgi:protein gp37